MPTVVDSLVVVLGLDPSQFTAGRKQAAQDFIDLKNQAGKTAKEVESSGKRAAQFFSQVRTQALLLFAAFTGGRGMKQFLSDITASDAALGRMANIAGTTTMELSKWRGMARAAGGSADSAAQSINGFNQSLVKLSLTGESEIIPYLRALQAFAPQVNLSLADANGNMRTAIDMLPDLHKAVQGMDAARATAILSGMGLGQDLINVLMLSDKAFQKYMSDQQRWGLVTKEQAATAQRLQYITNGVTQSFETLGRVLLNKLAPSIELAAEKLIQFSEWLQKDPKRIEAAILGIIAVVTTLAVVLGGPITAIAAIAAAIAVLYADWETYQTTGSSTFEDFWKIVEEGWKWIAAGIDIAKKGLALFTDMLAKATTAALDFMSNLGARWTRFWDNVDKAILGAGPRIMAGVKKVFGEAFAWAIRQANMVWRALTGHDLIGSDSQENAENRAALDAQAQKDGQSPSGNPYRPNPADRKRQEEDIQHFMSKGWSREQAAGIVANILAESGGDHTIKENGGRGPGYGLAQWTSPDRKAKFKELYGKDITQSTRQEQLDYIDWELNNSHKGAGDSLRKQTTEKGASDVVLNQYEMPAERKMNSSVRGSIAKALMKAPVPAEQVPTGAALAASSAARSAPVSNQSSMEMSIGTMNINTQATDAVGISKDVEGALNDRFESSLANYGQI